jgi:hypothetical protein
VHVLERRRPPALPWLLGRHNLRLFELLKRFGLLRLNLRRPPRRIR